MINIINCPHCGKELQANPEWGGMETSCPFCKQSFTIPKQTITQQFVSPSPNACYGGTASLWTYFVSCLTTKYCRFSGRASRKEFWGYYLFSNIFLFGIIVLAAILGLSDLMAGEATPQAIIGLLIYFGVVLFSFLPSLGVLIRRLHDTGHSGWFFFLGMIPYIGGIILFIFEVLPSQQAPNQYGDAPDQY